MVLVVGRTRERGGLDIGEKETERQRDRDRQTDRQTDRVTDRQRGGSIDKQTE